MRRAVRGGAVVGVLVVSLAGLVGCSSSDGPQAGSDLGAVVGGQAHGLRRASSSPFTVGAPPDGWTLVSAGMGTAEQGWGSDMVGDDLGQVRLAKGGGPPTSDLVVSTTSTWEAGVAEHEIDRRTELDVDGRRGYWVGDGSAEQLDLGRERSLAVVWGDDEVIRVTGPGSDEELIEAARSATPATTRLEAPVVIGPPQGRRVVGSFDADLAIALRARAGGPGVGVPGETSAHGAGWIRDPAVDSAQLAVMALPGGSVDIDALERAIAAEATAEAASPYEHLTPPRRTEVDGRPALAIERSAPRAGRADLVTDRALVAETDRGDVLVLRSVRGKARGDDPLGHPELSDIAASVAPASAGDWDRLVAEAGGGPGLHADAGRTQLASGEVDGLGWLLQTGAPGPSSFDGIGAVLDGAELPDECVKVSDGTTSCASEIYSGPSGEVRRHVVGGNPGPTVVVSTVEAASVRLTTADGDVRTAEAVAVPGGRSWVAVLDGDPGLLACGPPQPDRGVIEALDASGAVVSCVAGL